MNTTAKIYISDYPNAVSFWQGFDDVQLETKQSAVISNYWEDSKKMLELTPYEFIDSLFGFANRTAADSIKRFFSTQVTLDTLNGQSLYVLAKASYQGKQYHVLATSEHKYHCEHYHLVEV